MGRSKIKARAMVLMAAILWGTIGSAQAFAPPTASPIVIGAMRMVLGGSTLFLVAKLRGAFKTELKVDKKTLFMASMCIAAFQPLFFSGISQTGIAFGTILALGSAPVFSGIIEYCMGEKLSKRWAAGTAVSIIGCTLLFAGQGSINMNVLGSILSLGAGLSFAGYVKLSQKLLKDAPRDAVNGLIFFTCAVMLMPILFLSDLSWVLSARGIMVTLHLGIVTVALAYTLFAHGVVDISTPEAVTLTLAEPLTAAMLGVILFKEKLTGVSTVGILLLFCGLIINSYTEKEAKESVVNLKNE